MAKIFTPTSKSSSNKVRKHRSAAKQLADFDTTISHYDHEGKGIARHNDGRVVFVTGAIQGETVRVRPQSYTDKIIKAEVINVVQPSPHRVTPACRYFATCGGCELQYLTNEQQLAAKQSGVDALMQRQLNLTQIPWQPAITGADWHYRRSARLAIWFLKNGQFNMGFRQRKSKDIVDIELCPVLDESLSQILPELKQTIAQLQCKTVITHVQLFALSPQNAIIFRTVKPLAEQDKKLLADFAQSHRLRVVLEHNDRVFEAIGPDFQQAGTVLEYQVANTRYQFLPHNFIQVNADINQQMLQQALRWLDIKASDNVLDLFSGVGNFTLALAERANHVVAVEGVNSMVTQLKHNAALNQRHNVSAYQADLSTLDDKNRPKWLKPIDKLVLDPARDGAFDVVKKIPLLKPKQILYVSCNPTTLIRDIKVLQQANYKLSKMGLLNMFPHTSHVEAMALLEYK